MNWFKKTSGNNTEESEERRNQWAREHWFPVEAVGFGEARVCYTKKFQRDIKVMERKHCHAIDDIKERILELLIGGKEATRLTLFTKIIQSIVIKGAKEKLPKGCLQSRVGKWRFYWYHDIDENSITFYRVIYRGDIKTSKHK